MATFIETQFPTSIKYGASGGPEYLTDIIEVKSGHESRSQMWSYSRGPWSVDFLRTDAEVATLIAFFRAMRGRGYGFRFKDWSDYSATDQNLGTGDGFATDFQLRKAYTTTGATTFYRDIFKPVSGTVTIYIDDVEQESGWSVDTTNGVVTFDSAPAVGETVTADFEFDIKARFDTDYLSIVYEAPGIWLINGLNIVELKYGNCSEEVSSIVLSGAEEVTSPGGYQYSTSGGSGPYTWEVTGTGASIDTSGYVTLTEGACGTFIVTVTDRCGNTDSLFPLITNNGAWVEISDVLCTHTICVRGTFDCIIDGIRYSGNIGNSSYCGIDCPEGVCPCTPTQPAQWCTYGCMTHEMIRSWECS